MNVSSIHHPLSLLLTPLSGPCMVTLLLLWPPEVSSQQVRSSPVAALTNYHGIGHLKQHKSILSQWSEVRSGSHCGKIKLLAGWPLLEAVGENRSLCLF